jgi:hypothetical protein
MYLVAAVDDGIINSDFTKVFERIDRAKNYLVETAKEYDIPDVNRDMELPEIEKRIHEELEFSNQNLQIIPIQRG